MQSACTLKTDVSIGILKNSATLGAIKNKKT